MAEGIGRLLKLALGALETGRPMEKVQNKKGEMVWPWDHEMHTPAANAGSTPPGLPGKARQMGSSNFGVVANVCELAQGRISPNAGPPRIERAATWLKRFYLRQGPDGDLGHCLLEPLSTIYGEAHIVSALIAYALGIKEAGVFLERELALGLLHRCPNGRIVSASTRAGKSPRHWALEDFARLALQGRDGRGGKPSLIKRAFALENGWRAPAWMRQLNGERRPWHDTLSPEWITLLDQISFASGPLVVTHHGNGHVSRFETGPICYASPVVAAVACYEPWDVYYASFPGNAAKPFTQFATRYDPEITAVIIAHASNTDAFRLWDISALGPVVAEIRFEEVQR